LITINNDKIKAQIAESMRPFCKKVYSKGDIFGVEVGMLVFDSSQFEKNSIFTFYDTAGKYSENNYVLNTESGLPRIRELWQNKFRQTVLQKTNTKTPFTQLYFAKQGIITPEMEYVALRETQLLDKFPAIKLEIITPQFICTEIANGRAIIPSNKNHTQLEPMIIGKNFKVKINTNIGNSINNSCINEELNKAIMSAIWGSDTIMDLSTGADLPELRSLIIKNSPIPVGTVPIYEALKKVNGKIKDLNYAVFKEVLYEQCEQGVDYFTIHAGTLQNFIPYTKSRITGIVSRGGAIMANWMHRHKKENFLFENFDDICYLLAKYDVSISLGDGLRPGSIADSNDVAQFSELKTIGELVKVASKNYIQVMAEGPGHVALNKIRENFEMHTQFCGETPFYTLGPLVTDCALGSDHISSAIGGALIASYGTSMLCCVTPNEHIGLPNIDDIRDGIYAFKVAAHSADLAKGLSNAIQRDLLMSKARASFNWQAQISLSLNPSHVLKCFNKNKKNLNNNYCTMCGADFCSMKITAEIKSVD
jgi:phosphomethylpyrimidine synthase